MFNDDGTRPDLAEPWWNPVNPWQEPAPAPVQIPEPEPTWPQLPDPQYDTGY